MTFAIIWRLLIACLTAILLVLISNFLGNLIIPVNNYQTKNEVTSNKKTHATIRVREKKLNIKQGPTLVININKGKRVAKKCVSCHSLEKKGKNKIGPNLYNIINRKRGAVSNYNYSKAIKIMGGNWNAMELNEYIKNPKKFIPGTKMSFGGIKSEENRFSLILYLAQLSDNPINLSNELIEE